MYNYDNTIFDNFKIPEQLDREILIENIMLELGEMELIYNNPNLVKYVLEKWSEKEVAKWRKLYETTMFVYNPIHNYDREEEFADKEIRDLTKTNKQTRDLTSNANETRNLTSSENETRDLTLKTTETRNLTTGVQGTSGTTDADVQGGSNVTHREVSAYNTDSLATEYKETQNFGATNTKTVNTTTNQTGTDSGTVVTDVTDSGTDNRAMTDAGTVAKKLSIFYLFFLQNRSIFAA